METDYSPLSDASSSLSERFSWMSTVILFFPMWTKQLPHSRKPRSRCFSLLMVAITIVINLYHGGAECVVYLWLLPKTDGLIYHIMYAIAEAFVTISRFFSLYYFYRHFNFPWNQLQNGHHLQHCSHTQSIRRFKAFTICVFTITVAVDLSLTVYMVISNATSANYHDSALMIVARVFVFLPLYITFTTAAVVFFKYHLEILAMQETLKKGTDDFDAMLEQYVAIKKQFEREYPVSLEYCLLAYLFVIVLDLWVSAYEILKFQSFMDIADLLTDLLLLVLYFGSASLVAEAYHQYETMLYEFGRNTKKQAEYNYFLSYVTRYQLAVKIGQTKITKKSAVTIATVFVLAKLIGYSLRIFDVY